MGTTKTARRKGLACASAGPTSSFANINRDDPGSCPEGHTGTAFELEKFFLKMRQLP